MRLFRYGLYALLFLLAVVVVLPTGLETVFIKPSVDRVFDSLDARAKERRTDLDIRYDTLSVSGLFWGKHLRIERPRISWSEREYTQILVIPDIQIRPRSLSFKNWQVRIEGESRIFSNVREVAKILQDTPIEADIDVESFSSKALESRIRLFRNLTIVPTLERDQQASIGFAEAPQATLRTGADGTLTYLKLDVTGMEAKGPHVIDRYALQQAAIIYEKKQQEDSPVQELDAVIRGLEVPEYVHPYGAAFIIARASLDGELDWSGNLPLQLMSKKTTLDLKEASLNFADFGLNAKGNMTTMIANMPEVDAQIMLRNAMLLANEAASNLAMSNEQKNFVYAALSKIAGQPTEQIQDLVIPITRAGKDELTIGAIPLSKWMKALGSLDVQDLN